MAKVTVINSIWALVMCVMLGTTAVLYAEKSRSTQQYGPSSIAMLER